MPLWSKREDKPTDSPKTPRKRFRGGACAQFGLASASAALASGREAGFPGQPGRRKESGVLSERELNQMIVLPGGGDDAENSVPLLQDRRTQVSVGEGETDYEVVFVDSFLGLELRPREMQNETGAVVSDCLTQLTQRRVKRGSWVTSVNNRTVEGEPYQLIRKLLLLAQQNPPLTMTFSAPEPLESMMEIPLQAKNFAPLRGDLIICVVVALNLKHSANFVQVDLEGTPLFTSTMAPDRNVEFKQRLTFRSFRPAPGKVATATVMRSKQLRKDKKIGRAEFVLPTRFSEMKRETLELRNKKGVVTGLLILSSILVVP